MSILPDSTPDAKSAMWGIAGEALRKKNANPNGGKTKDIRLPENVSILIFIVLLLTMASLPMKILVRKNFGSKAINWFEIIFGAGFFVYAAGGLFRYKEHILEKRAEAQATIEKYNLPPMPEFKWWAWPSLNAAYILMAIAVIILIKGFYDYIKAQRIESDNWVEENYRGDSLFFKKRATTPKMQLRIWSNIEPTRCLLISLLLIPILWLGAIPFILSSIAFKANEYYHVKYKWQPLLSKANNNASNASNGDSYFAN